MGGFVDKMACLAKESFRYPYVYSAEGVARGTGQD